MNNETPAIQALIAFLDNKGWKHFADEDGILRGLVGAEALQWHWSAHVKGSGNFLVFKSYCPMNIPEARLTAASEYLSRANWGLHFGGFEIDWSDGQVCFRTSLPTVSAQPETLEAIEHLVYGNTSLMERYLPGLLAVGCGAINPAKAIEEAEKDLCPQEPSPTPPSETIARKRRPRRRRNDRLFPSDN